MTSSSDSESSRCEWPQSVNQAHLFILKNFPAPPHDDLPAWARRYLFTCSVYAHVATDCVDPIENARAMSLSYAALEQHLTLIQQIDEQCEQERRDTANRPTADSYANGAAEDDQTSE